MVELQQRAHSPQLMERSGNPVYRDCGECERIKKLAEFLTVEDSLQLATGNLQTDKKINAISAYWQKVSNRIF
jgi:hypothetical protein